MVQDRKKLQHVSGKSVLRSGEAGKRDFVGSLGGCHADLSGVIVLAKSLALNKETYPWVDGYPHSGSRLASLVVWCVGDWCSNCARARPSLRHGQFFMDRTNGVALLLVIRWGRVGGWEGRLYLCEYLAR